MKYKQIIRRAGLLASVVTVISMGAMPAVSASTTPAASTGTSSSTAGNALRISPVRQDLTIAPGASQTIDVYVQNLTTQTVTLQGIVNDFIANPDESGTPDILLNPNSYAPSHGLKRYVAPVSDITLQPNEQKDVRVTINIPKGAAGGGYFGAVRFAPTAADNSKNVALTASVGSLVLVTVPGAITQQLSIASFGAANAKSDTVLSKFFTSSKSLVSVVRFHNTGNVQVQPFGKVELKKSGRVIGMYDINNETPRGNVLPDSIRRFTTPLTGIGSFGKYTLIGNFGYGTKGQLLTSTSTFYVVPVGLIVAVAVIILALLFLIFGLPRLIRAYNRSIVRKAEKRKK